MEINNPFDLSPQAKHHGRYLEINSRHLTEKGVRFLQFLADLCTPTGLMFEAFRIPVAFGHAGDIVGIKLIDTPWTGNAAEQLRHEHLDAGTPESLVNLMQLAARASMHILVFNPDADVLDGLPLYL